MKELKDYIHFYVGGKILINCQGEDIVCEVITVSANGSAYASGKCNDGKTFNSHGVPQGKLLLRPLTDMTEDESDTVLPEAWEGKPTIITNAAMTLWLISKGFDLFGLIESGLAIDAKTLKLSNEIL